MFGFVSEQTKTHWKRHTTSHLSLCVNACKIASSLFVCKRTKSTFYDCICNPGSAGLKEGPLAGQFCVAWNSTIHCKGNFCFSLKINRGGIQWVFTVRELRQYWPFIQKKKNLANK